MESVVVLAALTTITATMAAAVIWICRSMFIPLKVSIDTLSKAIERLQLSLEMEMRERHALELQVQKIEDRARSLQHRVEKLEQETAGADK